MIINNIYKKNDLIIISNETGRLEKQLHNYGMNMYIMYNNYEKDQQ